MKVRATFVTCALLLSMMAAAPTADASGDKKQRNHLASAGGKKTVQLDSPAA